MTEKQHLTGDAPERTLAGGIFPFSARANAREGIFSDILAVVLQCNPTVTVDEEFKDRFLELESSELDLESDIDHARIWEVYKEKYTATTTGENLIAVPFNPEIPKRIKPVNSNQWGTWYRLHMSRLEDESLVLDEDLHDRFRTKLDSLEPSNIFERAIVDIVKTFKTRPQDDEDSLEPLRPYIPAVQDNFRTDLEAWCMNDLESDSDWLRGCQDLIGIHFFMYYVQVALNLREEWERFTDPDSEEVYTPEMVPIPFGVESERASLDRPFVQIWKGSRGVEFSVRQDIYDSWGRLAVMRILNNTLAEHDQRPDHPVTLTEAKQRLSEESRMTAIVSMYEYLPDTEPPDSATTESLVTAATELVEAIDNYYRYDVDDAAPLSMGVRGVRRLADAEWRYLCRKRGRPGFRFQMADETLAFLARVFAESETRGKGNLSFKEFIGYLADRGIELDPTSQSAARESLESMGLLEQESDSGESVNVRTY